MRDQRLNKLVKISVLSAAAFILMLIEFPLPFFPEFLKVDISDFPALLGSFALGPLAGVIIEAVKNILHVLLKNTTAGIGEIANFVVGAAFVFAAGMVYKIKKDRAHALYGLIAGVVAMAAVAAVCNLFIFLPLYEKVLGFPIPAIVDAGAKINPAIKDLNTFVALSIVPFNILKGIIVALLGFLSYKSLSPILHR
ncbi:riboflavin transporter RibU [Oxobacter pfennigii]|uniref:Riboflavin transporter n=1 Tax=Oxobacter pfennigii TaxID=36849 RepID=A0A0P8W4W8_9CLOT|nr:ECF transporter S component [Oxobacter pfennigii]KPU43622.1 riboflavin transporter RibU [Oxobacter pfennigii]